jgi:hypothetical protein
MGLLSTTRVGQRGPSHQALGFFQGTTPRMLYVPRILFNGIEQRH